MASFSKQNRRHDSARGWPAMQPTLRDDMVKASLDVENLGKEIEAQEPFRVALVHIRLVPHNRRAAPEVPLEHAIFSREGLIALMLQTIYPIASADGDARKHIICHPSASPLCPLTASMTPPLATLSYLQLLRPALYICIHHS